MSSKPSPRTHAEARIAVQTYEPEPYDEPSDAPALVRIHVEEQFSGDIEAAGVANFLQLSLAEDSASFV